MTIENKPDLALFYEKLVEQGRLESNGLQIRILAKLQQLLDNLYHGYITEEKLLYKIRGLLRKRQNDRSLFSGMYIYGGVGVGKSMLMKIFYDHLDFVPKKYSHFHQFVREVHNEIFVYRNKKVAKACMSSDDSDPVIAVAKKIAKQVKIICFDEMQINDAADAVILTKLFQQLMDMGVSFIMTSNRAPEDLYKGGIQKEKFLDFVELLRDKMEIINLDGGKDYRSTISAKGETDHNLYFYPLNAETNLLMQQEIDYFTVGKKLMSKEISLDHKRVILINKYVDKLAIFDFEELCGRNLGAGDYHRIAFEFDIVVIDNIPKLRTEDRNEAKRFVHLIDELYEAQTKLVCRSEVPIEILYESGDGKFEFSRTISRIKYLTLGNTKADL